ncbi:MAG: response regulator [Thermodesulfobacteriota bacterium]
MGKSILAVDDSATMLMTISLSLEKEGYNVKTVSRGADALKLLNSGQRFHVILVDVHMPEMDGITLTSEIRKLSDYKFTPVIMVTTESRLQNKEKGRKAGATGWIVKPFKPDQLVSVIRKVCP